MNRPRIHVHIPRQRGAAAVLAMLFLVIGTTLTIAMYSLSVSNSQSAHNLSDVARAQAAAEAGVRWMTWRFNHMDRPWETKGNIDPATADSLWHRTGGLQQKIIDDLQTLTNPDERPTTVIVTEVPLSGGGSETISSVTTSWITMEDGGTQFQVRVAQDPYDKRFVTVTSIGKYRQARRYVSLDFRIDKKIRYAVVGKVPIQLGRNTIVEGPVAMANANKFPPLLMLSDFMHFDSTLSSWLGSWNTFLQSNHNGYDNRISVDNPVEFAAAQAAGYEDYNGDAYIDEFDLFLKRFNTDPSVDERGVQYISKEEFTNALTGQLYEQDLFALLDSINGPLAPDDPARPGYQDDRINFDEGYGKVRGNIELATTANAWTNWLNGQSASYKSQYGDINDFIQGTVMPTTPGQAPVEFGVPASTMIDLDPVNFKDCADNFKAQAGNGGTISTVIADGTVVENKVISAASANGGIVYEESPKGSGNFQAVYKRPVFKDITFKNCTIPKGLNALFDNCTFDGVTFVDGQEEITKSNGTPTYNKDDGMKWAKAKSSSDHTAIETGGSFRDTNGDGKWDQYRVPGLNSGTWTNVTTWDANNLPVLPQSGTFAYGTDSGDKKSEGSKKGNNIRFNDCTFTGPLAGSYATAYTHFANSWEFTGKTLFNNTYDETATIVSPQVNIEMGSFNTPGNSPSTLTGVVVAGNIDIRGSSNIDGSIIVTGDGAGNTTLAYFGATDASTDPNAPMPEGGWGKLLIRYNPNRALPDGINLPIQLVPQIDTYSEAVK